jgi:hypothetical protein
MPVHFPFPLPEKFRVSGVWYGTKVCETKVEFCAAKLPELGIECGEGVS